MSNSKTNTHGPDFISFQVRDLQASSEFYENVVGLTCIPAPNPEAAVFTDGSVSFAVRNPFPGVDLDQLGQLGAGIGVWFQCTDPAELHERLVSRGVTIVQEPSQGPFGKQFTFRDPDGYVVTIHGGE
ncbi:VOC family protein [Actinomycetaceae bacterium L2_0104]